MTLKTLTLSPGIVTEGSARSVIGRWKDGSLVWFNGNDPEKWLGWQKEAATQFTGICRALTNWVDLNSVHYIGLGTHLKYELDDGGAFADITPYRDSGTLGADPITTVSGSPLVTIHDTAHDVSVGDSVYYGGTIPAVNGVTLVTTGYIVTSVTDADNYVITYSGNASGSGSGGGALITFAYEIPIGYSSNVALLGYGTGTYSSGTYSTGTGGGAIGKLRLWSHDQWGEDLIINYRGGGIYLWDASAGTGTRATVISGAPMSANFILVSGQDRHLIAFGAFNPTTSAADPLYITWSDQGDYTTFTAGTDNTAGDKRLDAGTEIITAVRTRGQILILTDFSAHVMYPTGDEIVFAFQTLASNCGCIGPNALVDVNGVSFWMGQNDLFYFDGSVQKLPCEIRNHIFSNFNYFQKEKTYLGYYSQHRSIVGFYPSANSDENDLYFEFFLDTRVWAYGTLARTAWVGSFGKYSSPYSTSPDSYLYAHEIGNDDDASPMVAFIESYDAMAGDGEAFSHISRFIPDPVALEGTATMSLKGRSYPQGAQETKGPFNITTDTTYLTVRIRARQLAIRYASSTAGSRWRFAPPSVNIIQHGERS